MKCTAKDRQALLTLARDAEQKSILEARRDSLPERRHVDELEAKLRNHREREVKTAPISGNTGRVSTDCAKTLPSCGRGLRQTLMP